MARLPEFAPAKRAGRKRPVEHDPCCREPDLGPHPPPQDLGDPLRIQRCVELGDHLVQRGVEVGLCASATAASTRGCCGTSSVTSISDAWISPSTTSIRPRRSGEGACLRDRHRADPLSFGQEVVRVRADDHVHLALDELRQLGIDRGRGPGLVQPPVAQMREANNELSSLLAHRTAPSRTAATSSSARSP